MENNMDQYIIDTLKSFKLVEMREQYTFEIEKAIKSKLSYKEFLVNLIKVEEIGKQKRSIDRSIKNANFETIKTFQEYDFSFHNHSYTQKLKSLKELNFIKQKENIILIGPPGVGKSHIATALGIEACNKGYKVLFVNASKLMNDLLRALSYGNINLELKKLSKIDLLIIDELGYLIMDKEKESLFFQLIRHRYEKNSLIITTNLPFKQWNEVFTSQIAATAILDRVIHHSHVISITGDSYRVKGKGGNYR